MKTAKIKTTKRDKPGINPFFLIAGGKTEADSKIDEERLRQAYDALVKYVKISHSPEKETLEVLVETRQNSKDIWIDISPKNATVIDKIEFNFHPPQGKYWRTVPYELADIDYVRDADCVEFAIENLKYRLFCKPGPKSSPKIDSEISTGYYIYYKLLGGVWLNLLDLCTSPADQIGILDGAFSTLKKYAELYYREPLNNGSPYIRLAFERTDELPIRGRGKITAVRFSYLHAGCLGHLLFKQQSSIKDRAVVLGIHGGTHVNLRIGNVDYSIEMTPESILDKF